MRPNPLIPSLTVMVDDEEEEKSLINLLCDDAQNGFMAMRECPGDG